MPRIALVGGGSGGHIYPLLAVAEELNTKATLRYFGDPGVYRLLIEAKGVKISTVPQSKWRAYSSSKNFFDLFRFIAGFFIALAKLYWYMPDIAFSKGGPGALPIILACRWYRIPIILHETDMVMGRTNTITARFAKAIELAYLEARDRLPKTKAEVHIVGNPVRKDLAADESREKAKLFFGLNPNLPLLLVLGGSLGSRRINEFILDNLRPLLDRTQVLHQVGIDNFEEHKKLFEFLSQKWQPDIRARYQCVPYLNETMNDAMNAADCIVSRAGGTIFEIAAKGRPSILIPLPEAAHNHQTENAYAYAKTGAAVVLEEANLLPSVFLTQIDKILKDAEARKKMEEAAQKFAIPDSAVKIAENILRYVHL